MLSPLTATQCLQYCTQAVSEVQNIMTNWAYDHINDNFFTPKKKKISSMQGHTDQQPETQLVKSSHSSVAAGSSLLI
jgi:hypothetical protein